MERIILAATRWAEEGKEIGRTTGIRLGGCWERIANQAGVQNPGAVRIVGCKSLPTPRDPALLQFAQGIGMFGDTHVGLTLGHTIFIRRTGRMHGFDLMAQELMHVAQMERLGGVQPFFTEFVRQIGEVGYANAPLEWEARLFARPYSEQ